MTIFQLWKSPFISLCLRERCNILVSHSNPPTICIHGKKGSKLANVEDNDDTVLHLYTLPVAGSRTRAIVILRLRAHVGVPFGACIIPTVVGQSWLTNERKSSRFTLTSSHIKSLQPCNEFHGQACRFVSQERRNRFHAWLLRDTLRFTVSAARTIDNRFPLESTKQGVVLWIYKRSKNFQFFNAVLNR